tara:strand:- start:887 stop:1399 length:513 start_codon:yes stop_codon:yes gene_type:complete
MKTEKVKISQVKRNKDNPRLIKDNKFHKLVNSIKEFPEMLQIRPIVVNDNMVVLGGNMRLKACQEAGLKEVYVIKADELTEKQQREFIIKDNVGFGDWDWDMVANEWELDELKNWGMDVPKFELSEDDKDLSDTFMESFRIEVELESEEEQEKLYNELLQKGYICRVLTL